MYNRKLALVADIICIIGTIFIFIPKFTGYGCIVVALGISFGLSLIVKYWISTK